MQQSFQINRAVQRTSSIAGWVDEKKNQVSNWLNARNDFFSILHGEDFTNRHVVIGHAAVVAMVLICILAEWLEGGAL